MDQSCTFLARYLTVSKTPLLIIAFVTTTGETSKGDDDTSIKAPPSLISIEYVKIADPPSSET
jgi:hypothetical protein